MAVKGTAVEILHPLLLTKRCGKSPIRMRKVKLVALRSFDWDGQLTGDALAPRSSPLLEPRGCFLRTAFRFCSLLLAGWLLLPSVLPAELRVHPSAQSLGVRLLNVEIRKTSTSHRIWFGLQCVKQRRLKARERTLIWYRWKRVNYHAAAFFKKNNRSSVICVYRKFWKKKALKNRRKSLYSLIKRSLLGKSLKLSYHQMKRKYLSDKC